MQGPNFVDGAVAAAAAALKFANSMAGSGRLLRAEQSRAQAHSEHRRDKREEGKNENTGEEGQGGGRTDFREP